MTLGLPKSMEGPQKIKTITTKHIYEMETDSQIKRTDCGCQGGSAMGKGRIGSLELVVQTIIYRMDKQRGPII